MITVHDLIHLYHPASKSANIYARLILPLTVKKAAHIIAVSNATKQDLIKRLGVPENKITVIHNGVEGAFHPVEDPEAIRAFRTRHNLSERFILYTGATKPHKNVPILLRALARADSGMPLVLTANENSLEDPGIAEAIQRNSLANRIVFAGFFPEEEMPLLYNAATMLVLPSKYEGFGFPALEAMACGLPVICSNASSLPEVVGDAALTFSPDDADELSKHITALLADAILRESMISRGLTRAAGFSWADAAKKTLRLYLDLASSQ